jgi:hypothetical protein
MADFLIFFGKYGGMEMSFWLFYTFLVLVGPAGIEPATKPL